MHNKCTSHNAKNIANKKEGGKQINSLIFFLEQVYLRQNVEQIG